MSKLQEVELTESFKKRYYERLNLNGQFKLSEMRKDPVKFAKHMLGFSVRDYQAYLLDQLEDNQKIVIVKGRQIGFSTILALFCVHQVFFNRNPSGQNRATEITVISKDDDSAKDLLQKIKDFMYAGDRHMAAFLKGRPEHTNNLFTREIVKDNVDELKLKNFCIVRSYPPTAKVRHTANSILIIDEFAFLNNGDHESFFYTDALPTISATGGKVILSSTPKGYGGLFFDLVDPENKKEHHDFKRFMFPFSLNKDVIYSQQVELMRANMDEKKFQQEYMCDFTQNDANFFISRKVKEMFDQQYEGLDMNKYDWVAAVDYGMTESRSVIALCTEIDGKIVRGYVKEFESGYDINGIIPFMQGLKDRYKITKIVVDDCPQGDAINKGMIALGWNVFLFDFKVIKEETYCAFRNRLNSGEVKMAYDADTEKQFLELQEEESHYGKLMIHKPRNGKDDIVAATIMASSQFLSTTSKVGAYLV